MEKFIRAKLEQNPFDNTLVADIGKIIDKSSNVVAKVIIGNYSQEVRLSLQNSDFKVDYMEAIEFTKLSLDDLIDVALEEMGAIADKLGL